MFISFSEIDKKMEIRVLISWKGRVAIESTNKYRNINSFQIMYSNFCDIIHNKPCVVHSLMLRLHLIKVLNYKMSFRIKLNNLFTHLFSRKFGISDSDRTKIITAWNIRTKLEKNMRYIYSDEIKGIYQHLSNILHGEIERHNMSYINSCEKKVDNFFEEIRNLETYKLKYNQTILDLNNIDKLLRKKSFKSDEIKNSTIFFFKSTNGNHRTAFIESEPVEIERILNNKHLVLKRGSKDSGLFEYVDSSKFHNLFKLKYSKLKITYRYKYQLFYKKIK